MNSAGKFHWRTPKHQMSEVSRLQYIQAVNIKSAVTSIFKLLIPALLLALVKAIGSWQAFASRWTNWWFGIRIPTSFVPVFKPGLSSFVLSNTRVTGPGKRLCRILSQTATLPHLKETWHKYYALCYLACTYYLNFHDTLILQFWKSYISRHFDF